VIRPATPPLALEGCLNFRDLGGYPAAGGRSVPWRTLCRSDALHRLTDADTAALGEMGLATVIDLRSHDELERLPGPPRAPWLAHHLPIHETLPDPDTYLAWADPAAVSLDYLDMLEEGAASLARCLGLLCEPATYPVLFHCAVGKDRTGVVAALVLGLLGVGTEDIVADYVQSAPAVEVMVERLVRTGPEPPRPAQLAALGAVEATIMEGFLAGLADRYGSFSGYAEAVGVPEAGPGIRLAVLGRP